MASDRVGVVVKNGITGAPVGGTVGTGVGVSVGAAVGDIVFVGTGA